MKIVMHYTASAGFRRALAARAADGFELVVVDLEDVEGLRREMREAEVLFHVLAPVTAAAIEAAPKLRMIQKIGVGLDTIDLEAARRRGIVVANMPGTNSQAVAEMTLLLMLAALRRVAFFDRKMRAGDGWSLAADCFDAVGELNGRTVGFLGYGAIPQRLAPALRALGARVIHHTRTLGGDDAANWRTRDDLFAQADLISLHVPLSDDTLQVINAASLARMKPGVVIVNTGRGGLVDQDALVEALRSGHVAAAGLDVVAQEPASDDNPLFGLDNVVVTPHIAWLTPETLSRSLDIAFENCRRLAVGEALRHQVLPRLS